MTSDTPALIPEPRQGWLDAIVWNSSSPFTRWLERWRYLFFAGLVVLILIPFNGQWRLGLDSSIYRGVAHNLAIGHGYTFAGRAQTQVYPGLPFLLAVSEKITGTNGVILPLVVMNLLSIATVFLVYALIRSRYPLWIAVVVTVGVGMNARFVQQAQEVMTDTPFLFGCVMAMLGWERLSLVATRRGMAASALMLIIGLFIAATMRPTFWVLAAAWVLSAVWNVVWRRERRSMIALAALVVVFIAFALLDPRMHGLNVLEGSYEKQFIQSLPTVGERLRVNARGIFSHEIAEAFFGEPMAWTGPVFAIALLLGAILVTLRQPVWGLQVFILTGIMLMLSDMPRYYLMVLPALWLGYVLLLLVVLHKLASVQRDVLLFAFFSLANFMNFGTITSLLREQHSGNFLAAYRHGTYIPYVRMADALRRRMAPGETAIGPVGQLLSFLSDRDVLNGKLMGFETLGLTKYPAIVAAASPKYLVGPADLYDHKDPEIYRLLIHGVIVPGKLIEKVDSQKTDAMWISTMSVNVPDTDWRKLPTTRPRALADRPPKHVLTPEQIEYRARKARKQLREARLEHAARMARKLRRQHSLDATHPATQPTSSAMPLPGARALLCIAALDGIK